MKTDTKEFLKIFSLFFLFIFSVMMMASLSGCNYQTVLEDVPVMQQEEIVGTWYGDSKVESGVQPGYFYNQRTTITVGPVDTSIYSIEKYRDDFYITKELLFLTIEEQGYMGEIHIVQKGYLHDRGEEYGSKIVYSFKSILNGMGDLITFSMLKKDSIRITLGTYKFLVGKERSYG